MLLLVTGDRNWRNAARIQDAFWTIALEETDPGEEIRVMHGFARGADYEADVVAQLLSQEMREYSSDRSWLEPLAIPALWSEHGKAAGPIRNQAMLDRGPDYVVGFHNDILSSRGTRDMLRRCAKAGIPGRLFTEEGEVEEWQSLVSS